MEMQQTFRSFEGEHKTIYNMAYYPMHRKSILYPTLYQAKDAMRWHDLQGTYMKILSRIKEIAMVDQLQLQLPALKS